MPRRDLASSLLRPAARASDRIGLNASNVRLAVSPDGKRALVTYRAQGRTRHVLVWGAANALAAEPGGAAGSFHDRLDRRLGDVRPHDLADASAMRAAPTTGPPLADVVAACKGSDGSYWAVQRWQPKLAAPRLSAVQGGADRLGARRLALDGPDRRARASTPTGRSTAKRTTCSGGSRYGGVPVYGFHTVKGTGAPQDRYGRSLYIDTLDSAYGRGWKRETSIVFRNPTGVFCYSFWPTNDVVAAGPAAAPRGRRQRVPLNVHRPGRDAEPRRHRRATRAAWDPNDAGEDAVPVTR